MTETHGNRASMQKKSILIVEDEKPLAHALELRLTQEGYAVTIATDGEEARRVLQDRSFDLILLDILLPKMDGLAFLELLKKAGTQPTPVVVLSNLGKPQEVQRAMELGAKEYLVKSDHPMQSIVAKVGEILKQCSC